MRWVGGVLFGVLAAGPARADVSGQCAADRTRGEVLRQREDLRGALYAFRACSAPECSDSVRDACAAGHDAVAASMPAIVVAVRDARGAPIANAHVIVDGSEATRVHGAFIVDPGEHTVRVDGIDGVEQHVTIRDGEHKSLLFASNTFESRPLSHSPAWPWIVTSTGATGVIVGTVLTAVGYAMFPNAIASCRTAFGCAESDTFKEVNHAGIGVVIGSSIVTAAGVVWLLLNPHRANTLAFAPNALTF